MPISFKQNNEKTTEKANKKRTYQTMNKKKF